MEERVNVILDYDGTLHEALAIYAPAFRGMAAFLQERGFLPPGEYGDEVIAPFLGQTRVAMWESFLPELPEEVRMEGEGILGSSMARAIEEGQARFYPGALEALEEMKARGWRIFILSNCVTAYLEAHRQAFRLDRFITGYYPGEAYGFRPKEEILPLILEAYPGPGVMVGDRIHDMKAALHNGIPAIACLYGYGKLEEFASAALQVSSPLEIPAGVKGLVTHV